MCHGWVCIVCIPLGLGGSLNFGILDFWGRSRYFWFQAGLYFVGVGQLSFSVHVLIWNARFKKFRIFSSFFFFFFGGGEGEGGCKLPRFIQLVSFSVYGFHFRHALWLPFVTAFAVLKGLILNLNSLFQGAVSFHLSVGTQNQTWLLLVKIKCDIFVKKQPGVQYNGEFWEGECWIGVSDW